MDYKKLNQLLNEFFQTRPHYIERVEHDYSYDLIYKFDDKNDIYIQITYDKNSYGDQEELLRFEFVQPQEVKVTNFKAI
jgi:hypothetical protein